MSAQPPDGDVETPTLPERPDACLKCGATFAGSPEPGRHSCEALRAAIRGFNTKPNNGLDLLRLSGLLDPSPAKTAEFLRETRGLLKRKIGEYLGEPENVEVLEAYVSTFDFHDLAIDEALRSFLTHFRLPGEAQKIDRIMEKFAARYMEHNPESVFKSADAVYVLAFAIIMLNTDAHNPAVKNKMTQTQFLSNLRGTNDGDDLPTEFVIGVYDAVVQREIVLNEERPWDVPEMCGWLKRHPKWGKHARWCVLANGNLFYFLDEKPAKEARGTISMAGLCVSSAITSKGEASPTAFVISHPTGNLFWVRKRGKEMETLMEEFEAATPELCKTWMEAIRNGGALPVTDALATTNQRRSGVFKGRKGSTKRLSRADIGKPLDFRHIESGAADFTPSPNVRDRVGSLLLNSVAVEGSSTSVASDDKEKEEPGGSAKDDYASDVVEKSPKKNDYFSASTAKKRGNPAVAIADYSPTHADELPMAMGTRVLFLHNNHKAGPEWSWVEIDGAEGLVPGNHIEMVTEDEDRDVCPVSEEAVAKEPVSADEQANEATEISRPGKEDLGGVGEHDSSDGVGKEVEVESATFDEANVALEGGSKEVTDGGVKAGYEECSGNETSPDEGTCVVTKNNISSGSTGLA